MADNIIHTKKYCADGSNCLSDISDSEIWRYAGFRGKENEIGDELLSALKDVKSEMKELITYRVCYSTFDVSCDSIVLPFESNSENLLSALNGAERVVFFAATLGIDVDRYIMKMQHVSPVKALLAQSFGAERIEALCDCFMNEMQHEAIINGEGISRRFSPGYGDFSLEKQKDFFTLLDLNRKIGLSLNSSLLISPSKSVTAVFGIGKNIKRSSSRNKCLECNNILCEFRNI